MHHDVVVVDREARLQERDELVHLQLRVVALAEHEARAQRAIRRRAWHDARHAVEAHAEAVLDAEDLDAGMEHPEACDRRPRARRQHMSEAHACRGEERGASAALVSPWGAAPPLRCWAPQWALAPGPTRVRSYTCELYYDFKA